MTQEQLAERVGIDQKQISKIELGRVYARLSTYLSIANTLDVSIDYFLADALIDQTDKQSANILSGDKEQQFLKDVMQAALRYLEEKEV